MATDPMGDLKYALSKIKYRVTDPKEITSLGWKCGKCNWMIIARQAKIGGHPQCPFCGAKPEWDFAKALGSLEVVGRDGFLLVLPEEEEG